MKYTVAVVQIDSGEDREENLRKIETAVREAASKGAAMVVFPETVEYIGNDFKGNASAVPGQITDFFSGLAKENRVWIHCGSVTAVPRDNSEKSALPTNTSLLFDTEGKLIGSYSKLHMFDIDLEDGTGYRESDDIQAGDEIVLCDTELGMFGLAICYDMRFGELFRLQALHGAQIFFVPANFTRNTGKDHWEPILRTRAIENACYVVAPCQCGVKPKFEAFGNSMVIDPWGNIIARAGTEEEIIYAEINTERVDEIRKQLPALGNRRKDIYDLGSEKVKICSGKTTGKE